MLSLIEIAKYNLQRTGGEELLIQNPFAMEVFLKNEKEKNAYKRFQLWGWEHFFSRSGLYNDKHPKKKTLRES